MSSLLQLCHPWDTVFKNQCDVPSHWLMSEKLDGMRCFWDGGVTRGQPKADVPWSYNEKDGRLKIKPISTGLWSRYGGVIPAPDWWIEQLPANTLDGELWVREYRQDILSWIKTDDHSRSGPWSKIEYRCYDAPPPAMVLAPRTMVVAGGRKVGICFGPAARQLLLTMRGPSPGASFRERSRWIPDQFKHGQEVVESYENMMRFYDSVLRTEHGEGIIVRSPDACYECRRSRHILKIKKVDEGEWLCNGVTDGEGKHLGRIGALRLEKQGCAPFHVGTGLSDSDRQQDPSYYIGKVITIRYRGLSKDGIPQEPRYVRVRSIEHEM